MSIAEQLRNDAVQLRQVGWYNQAELYTAAADRIDALQARVKRLEEAIVAADKYIDAIQADDSKDYTIWVLNSADARTAYAFAKQASKESKP